MTPIVLLDIDGTLLDAHGVGRRAVERVVANLVGRPVDTSSVSFSGKTDPQIFREILSDADLVGELDSVEDAIATAIRDYSDDMHGRLPGARVSELPGAGAFVRRLSAAGVPTGLLTGNLMPLAYLKVGRIGLEPALFPFGAFGSDSEHRNELPEIAVERAAAHLGRPVDACDVVVVGDTPLDVACARHGGCRAVAVTTGRYAAGDLADADLVLDSLDDLDLDALLAPTS